MIWNNTYMVVNLPDVKKSEDGGLGNLLYEIARHLAAKHQDTLAILT